MVDFCTHTSVNKNLTESIHRLFHIKVSTSFTIEPKGWSSKLSFFYQGLPNYIAPYATERAEGQAQ